MFTVSIIGRANVGKSTFFNKLAHQKISIVFDKPGTTIDYKERVIEFGDFKINLIDTGGYTYSKQKHPLKNEINQATETAIKKSDLLYLVVDKKSGLLDEDKQFAKQMLKLKIPMILVINKCDSGIDTNALSDFYKMPIKDICAISAEHSIGFNALYDLTYEYYKKSDKQLHIPETKNKVTFIGKPNVGKSTFINTLLNEKRVVVSPQAGTTRDSISIDFSYNNHKLQIIDTAGLRKKRKVLETLEKLSTSQTLSSVRQSDVAVLLMDVNNPLESQDLKISSVIVTGELKPIILAINKIDTKNQQQVQDVIAEIKHKISKKISLVKDVPIIPMSAINGQNVEKVLDHCIKIKEMSDFKIPTSQLNQWLEDVVSSHPPPLSASKKELRLKFIKQVSSSPLMFKLFMNKPKELPVHYIRYLIKSMQRDFDISSIPMKITPVATKNPYAK